MTTVKTALVSVSDKTNLEILAHYFKENNITVLSTGGTARTLKELGVSISLVSEVTGFPEVMDGRVKTLHPHIHMGLLARSDVQEDQELLKHYDLNMIDMVVVNLYPFSEKKEDKSLSEKELAEFIDVGGPSMLRAAAKNFNRIAVLSNPKDYEKLRDSDFNTPEQRKKWAGEVFKKLSDYDLSISNWLLEDESKTDSLSMFQKNQDSTSLRYGENPHQKSHWHFAKEEEGLHQAEILQGKELSFNNLVDLTAAIESLSVIRSSNKKTCISVKHNNPCGVGQSETLAEALKLSVEADPVSVFGSVIACDSEVSEKEAEILSKMFIECVVAPSFSKEALNLLGKKKNLRLLNWSALNNGYLPKLDFKRVSGGVLTQDFDSLKDSVNDWEIVSGNKEDISKELWQQFEFANKIVARLKSNAISLSNGNMSLGLGMGQVNRVDSVKLAIERWKEFHPDKTESIILASDAFFPFPDSIEEISKHNISWVLQPGGSIKDAKVIEAAQQKGVGMVFTKKRHFLH